MALGWRRVWQSLGSLLVSTSVVNSWAFESSAAGTLGGQAKETLNFAGTRLFVEFCAGETQEAHLSEVVREIHDFCSLTILD